MKPSRQMLLRANSLFLSKLAIAGLAMDMLGIFFARGPQASLLAAAPHTGIGFVQAHGLSLILSMALWRAAPTRSWHLTAGAAHALLGGANLAFWQVFIAADMTSAACITTSLHGLFAVLQFCAATVPFPSTLQEASR